MNNLQSNSDRFLNAFCSIEGYLQSAINYNSHCNFNDLIDNASTSIAVVKKHKDILKQYGRLRNAIVHNYSSRYNKNVIAEPATKVVDEIEKIENIIKNPPVVISTILKTQTNVLTLDTNESIGLASNKMLKSSFSQIPITDNDIFVGLLTTNTIARWISQTFVGDDDIFSSKETKILDVMKFAEYKDNYQFIKRDTDIFEVLSYFHKSAENGIILNALLITHNGLRTEKILGIVTAADLPKILNDYY